MHIVAVVLIVFLGLFKIYRRTRTAVGFQKFAKWRMVTRMALTAVAGVILLVTGLSNPMRYIFDAGGILLGGIIAYYSMSTSAFEWRKNDWFYRQNPRIDMILLVTFGTRVAYKAYNEVYSLFGAATYAQFTRHVPLTIYTRDPSVTGIIFTVITYYVVYYAFLICKEKQMRGPLTK